MYSDPHYDKMDLSKVDVQSTEQNLMKYMAMLSMIEKAGGGSRAPAGQQSSGGMGMFDQLGGMFGGNQQSGGEEDDDWLGKLGKAKDGYNLYDKYANGDDGTSWWESLFGSSEPAFNSSASSETGMYGPMQEGATEGGGNWFSNLFGGSSSGGSSSGASAGGGYLGAIPFLALAAYMGYRTLGAKQASDDRISEQNEINQGSRSDISDPIQLERYDATVASNQANVDAWVARVKEEAARQGISDEEAGRYLQMEDVKKRESESNQWQ